MSHGVFEALLHTIALFFFHPYSGHLYLFRIIWQGLVGMTSFVWGGRYWYEHFLLHDLQLRGGSRCLFWCMYCSVILGIGVWKSGLRKESEQLAMLTQSMDLGDVAEDTARRDFLEYCLEPRQRWRSYQNCAEVLSELQPRNQACRGSTSTSKGYGVHVAKALFSYPLIDCLLGWGSCLQHCITRALLRGNKNVLPGDI